MDYIKEKPNRIKELTGQKFGKLTVISMAGRKGKRVAWNCVCDCGNEVVVTGTHLKSGHTKSCGCAIKEVEKDHEDLTGKRFGRWTVLEEDRRTKAGHFYWKCRCDCGNIGIVCGSNLKKGDSKSCGCLAKELTSQRVKSNPKKIKDLTGKKFGKLTVVKMMPHTVGEDAEWLCDCECGRTRVVNGRYLRNGTTKDCGNHKPFSYRLTYPRLYRIWMNMRQRCNNPKNERIEDYGGRGIKVCDEWNNSFQTFADWALQNGYTDELTIDRIDVNGNYCPDNCQWITAFEQMSNMRDNFNVTYKGETHTLSEWQRRMGFCYSTMMYRLKNGWTVEEAFEIPIGQRRK